MRNLPHPGLERFAKLHHIEGLTLPSLEALNQGNGDYTIEKAHRFLAFQRHIDQELLEHRIITANAYTDWFRDGEQNLDQVRAFIVQFSVFSNQFLIAQINKMINADTLAEMRASKEILANEIGVSFTRAKSKTRIHVDPLQADPPQAQTEGTVEGGTFHFSAGHIEWLATIASELDLPFSDIGKRKYGTPATLHFCDALIQIYGATDYSISQAASYAVENWAAAGFWGELIEGFNRFNRRTGRSLPLGFFTWHDLLEAQHAEHTQEELEAIYFTDRVDEDDFIRVGNEMLDSVAVFWDGLNEQRLQLEAVH